MHDLLKIIWLFSPLLMGLAFHGLCMKFGWLSGLARPVDGGRKFRGQPLFGSNKTSRGIIAVGVGTALGFVLESLVLHGSAAGWQLEIAEYSYSRLALLGFAVGAAS